MKRRAAAMACIVIALLPVAGCSQDKYAGPKKLNEDFIRPVINKDDHVKDHVTPEGYLCLYHNVKCTEYLTKAKTKRSVKWEISQQAGPGLCAIRCETYS